MAEVQATLTGLLPFMAYFALGLAIMAAFMWIYTSLTPYDEIALVKANNAAAAIAWTGAILGFGIALSGALRESESLLEFLIWGVIAGIAQLLVFYAYRRFYPKLRERIEADEIASAIKLSGVAIAVGLLNASAMVY